MALILCPECRKQVSSEADACLDCGGPIKPRVAEPEFRADIRRVLIGGMIVCGAALPIGLALELPYVWGLSILGLIVAGWKLQRLETRFTAHKTWRS